MKNRSRKSHGSPQYVVSSSACAASRIPNRGIICSTSGADSANTLSHHHSPPQTFVVSPSSCHRSNSRRVPATRGQPTKRQPSFVYLIHIEYSCTLLLCRAAVASRSIVCAFTLSLVWLIVCLSVSRCIRDDSLPLICKFNHCLNTVDWL